MDEDVVDHIRHRVLRMRAARIDLAHVSEAGAQQLAHDAWSRTVRACFDNDHTHTKRCKVERLQHGHLHERGAQERDMWANMAAAAARVCACEIA